MTKIKNKYIATTKLGLESVVANELEALGFKDIRKEDARVIFYGDYYDLARACLWLRAAERVLMVVGEFEAKTFDELYENTKALNLKPCFTKDSFIHVNGKSAKSTLFSVSDCQSIVKKAIVDNLLSAFKTRVLTESGSRVIVEVGILRDQVTIALDACGAGLSRRGYRIHNYEAPISETLGAAIVLLSRYNADIPLIDPMCGSGTMPIEAAMIARNMAPGLNRSFAAQEWHFVEKSIFARAYEQARDSILDIKPMILGSDIESRAIELSKQHAKNAKIMVDWKVMPVSQLSAEAKRGIIVCNPPYGERMMTKQQTIQLYKDMRTAFDALPIGWSKHIITSMLDFERVYGKRASKRRNLSSGGKRCTLYSYFGYSNNER
ncbi:MAG TPA: class I SAM-dependent RNA methyltransferase [Clostridiales bacterium]|jgi:putative N6-adenine-specific DNA methylase|nr:class I SAM-dependent RNA methyltransferase [Clostridiales bacterium]